jgi:branched-chain amino acid aminotransferase
MSNNFQDPMLEIIYQPLVKTPSKELQELLTNPATLMHHTDAMLEMDFGSEWGQPIIKQYQPLHLDPATSSLHYGQSVFEGMKAYMLEDNRVALFRPLDHAMRFNRSAERIGLPKIPPAYFLELIEKFTQSQSHWVPKGKATALYLRPLLFSANPSLLLSGNSRAKFILFGSPVGSLHSKPYIDLYVEAELSRSSNNGTGNVKYSGNYGGTMNSAAIAKSKKCDQTLWLDGAKHKYVEELSGMNIFFVQSNNKKIKIITPTLGSTILPGITRDSIMKLSRDLGYRVVEEKISIEKLIERIKSGKVNEIFATGTMIGVQGVSSINYKNKIYTLPKKDNSITNTLKTLLDEIKYGHSADNNNFMYKI